MVAFKKLFESKRFWISIGTLAFIVLGKTVPALSVLGDPAIQQALIVLALTLVGGYSVQDAAGAFAAGKLDAASLQASIEDLTDLVFGLTEEPDTSTDKEAQG